MSPTDKNIPLLHSNMKIMSLITCLKHHCMDFNNKSACRQCNLVNGNRKRCSEIQVLFWCLQATSKKVASRKYRISEHNNSTNK